MNQSPGFESGDLPSAVTAVKNGRRHARPPLCDAVLSSSLKSDAWGPGETDADPRPGVNSLKGEHRWKCYEKLMDLRFRKALLPATTTLCNGPQQAPGLLSANARPRARTGLLLGKPGGSHSCPASDLAVNQQSSPQGMRLQLLLQESF